MLILKSELPRLQAWDHIHTKVHNGPLDSERVYDLILTATGDKDLADKTAAACQMEEIKRETMKAYHASRSRTLSR